MCDYRNTPLCNQLVDIKRKKNSLQRAILKEHPKVENIYNKVNNRGLKYFDAFMELYNHKCAYCGVSVDVYGLKLFEIDHYIPKASFKDEKLAGQITNLRFSCYNCNRKKKDFLIEEDYQKLLDPDDVLIAKVFKRTSDYSIIISEEYKDNNFIKKFYEKLAFNSLFRRLDFLLMNMINYSKIIKNIAIRDKLNSCIELLRRKKNKVIFRE